MSWPDSLEYVNFRQATHPNYRRSDIDYTKATAQAMKIVQDIPTNALSAQDDPRSLLELGIRYPFLQPLG